MIVYAVIGTMIAVIVRSTSIALAVGILWFGPIENVFGDGQSWAMRWFPGLLMRSVLRPDAPMSIATSTALATLALYMGVAVTVIAVVISRRHDELSGRQAIAAGGGGRMTSPTSRGLSHASW